MLTEVYHTTTIFQPSTQANRDQFDARISIIGRHLERCIHSRLWYLCSSPDDMDDAIQNALIRLWKVYQEQPWMMDMGDGWWIKIGLRAAQNALRGLIAQRGLKTATGVRRLEFNATSLETDHVDRDGLELVEIKHLRSEQRILRPESEQADRRIDAQRLVTQALTLLTCRQRETVQLLIPLVAQGYTINEAARRAGIGKDRAQYAWDAFQHACEEVSGQVRGQMKGKGAPASPDEMEQIRVLAELGLSCSVIAQRIGRNKNFVKEYFEKATGYRRGANNQRNPITPQRVEQMKQLRTQGLSMASIARNVGCSTGSVCHWLNQ
jgi:DNA-directed RNA polymerase specialized sigma24 family protein/transposase-like protein